ncbi:putative zinc finger protein 638-like [Scophthalmus maximus]|uniref:Putative zinc finger protein 638-like n=1 Tax=Scophthalmus maximus TaxID=52904 RepID=A0A2U9B095_SCOMX|nr:putative zinc finger protein 638-like [Scophthalmus maximus]
MGGAPERRVDPEVITSSSGVNVNDDTKSLKAPNINTEKRKTLVTLDEAGDNEKADEAEQSPRSAKRKHDDDVTEESVNFVTVDEVEVEEEEEEEEQEAAPRTRGRPKKRTRKTPVRKSTRGNRDGAKDEREDERESSGSDVPPLKDPSTLSSDGQREIQKSEGGGASQAHVDAASAGQDLRPEHPESQSLERCMEEGEEEEEGWSRPDVKVVTKRKSELVGPEAKRSRSQSPCVAADLNLPPFSPNNPLGQEFVVPKSGYFCNLCRVFYLNESSAKEDHCGSQRHYDNLQKYFQKHRHKPPTSTSPHSQGLASD